MEQAFRSPPAWSPDGKRIAFGTTTPSLEHRVLVVNADGSGRRRLAAGLYAAWGPGGKTIALEQDAGVFVRPLARGRVHRVGGRAGFGGSCPTWSPDGKRIALLTSANLSIVRPDGRGTQAARELGALPAEHVPVAAGLVARRQAHLLRGVATPLARLARCRRRPGRPH